MSLEILCSFMPKGELSPNLGCIFLKNVPMQQREEICATMQMDMIDDLGTYLGMPTLTSCVTCNTFIHLCKMIDRRLSGWKSKHLSLAKRITLAKSTITTLANYSMQTTKFLARCVMI